MRRDTIRQLPILELDTLRTLVAIADTGNFSAAGEVVFRTPSAVSMQVKKAEDILGRVLFRRDSRSVMATPDGDRLIQHGRRMLNLNREMMTQLLAADVSGVVRLGAPDNIAERALPDILRRFADTHGQVTVDVTVDTSTVLLRKVHEGALDLAMITCDPAVPQADVVEILYREPLTWAGARNGIAHEKTPLPVSVWDEGCVWRNAGLKSLQEAERDYRIAFMSAHISAQRAAIMADLAIAPLPVSNCCNGIVALGEVDGLPALGDYALAMALSPGLFRPALAAADHLRNCFASAQT